MTRFILTSTRSDCTLANSSDAPQDLRIQVESHLLDLITGRQDRASVANWAIQFILNDVEINDEKTQRAIENLSGADLTATDRPYLHSEIDFCMWLAQLQKP